MLARLVRLPVVRFGIVGVSNNLVGYAVFLLVLSTAQHMSAKAALAQGACYVTGMIWSFFWNKYWTFGSRGNPARQAARFFALQGLLMLISSLAMGILVDIWAWHASAAWLLIQGAVISLNYVLSRYWAFR
jgi:putative flippase GtrA